VFSRHEALVHQSVQRVQYVFAEPWLSNVFRGVQGATASERRQPGQEQRLVRREHLVRPVHNVPQGALTAGAVGWAAGEQIEAASQSLFEVPK